MGYRHGALGRSTAPASPRRRSHTHGRARAAGAAMPRRPVARPQRPPPGRPGGATLRRSASALVVPGPTGRLREVRPTARRPPRPASQRGSRRQPDQRDGRGQTHRQTASAPTAGRSSTGASLSSSAEQGRDWFDVVGLVAGLLRRVGLPLQPPAFIAAAACCSIPCSAPRSRRATGPLRDAPQSRPQPGRPRTINPATRTAAQGGPLFDKLRRDQGLKHGHEGRREVAGGVSRIQATQPGQRGLAVPVRDDA